MHTALLALLASDTPAGAPVSPFEVNTGLIFWTWVVFAALFFVLKKFAWPAILKATEEREQAIQRQLDEARTAQEAAEKALAQQQQLLAEARDTAQTMIADGRALAEQERQVALERTKQEQEALLDRAKRDIAAEKDKAVADLRREAVDIALAAAGKLINQRLTAEADRALVMEHLNSLESRN